MSEAKGGSKSTSDGSEGIFTRAKSAVGKVVRPGAETLKEKVAASIHTGREDLLVRVEKGMLARLDQLVEAGLFSSRSDASVFLMAKGIDAERELFDEISEGLGKIRDEKQELRDLLNDPPKRKAEEPDMGQQEGRVEPSTRSWWGLFPPFSHQ